MVAGQAAAGIAVMHEPVIAPGLADLDHYMVITDRRHSGSRRSPGKFSGPIGSQIEIAIDFSEQI